MTEVPATAAPPADRGAPVRLPDRYRVDHVIGRGGTAVVYAARDTLLNRPVAVKVFTSPTDSARVLREQQHEAQTLAGLSHHALVTLFDAGVDDSDPSQPHIYLVMERVDGPDLGQRLRSGALTPTQVCWLGFDLCDALLYVHERGYLHRDIKPANVLLTARHSERRLRGKLSDFGIAAVLGSSADEGEFTVGTAAYLSPEQVEGETLGPASDVYSLGLVLIQAVTGRVAYPGTVIESAFARLHRDPDVPPSLPERLQAVLRAMTQRAVADRLSLEEAREQFEAVLVEELAKGRTAAVAPVVARSVDPGVFDGPADADFRRITGIAARLLRTPAGFVALGDPGQETLAAVPEVHRAELGALAARCLAVEADGGWVVDDVRADARFSDVVRSAPVRTMAVQPIVAMDGRRTGVIAVLDPLPRAWDEDEFLVLADLAQLVAHEQDLRLAVRRALFSR